MNRSNLSDTQLQIRQNAELYRSYVGELNEWEKEMNSKSFATNPSLNLKSQPPIRSSGTNLKETSDLSFSGHQGIDKELAQVAKETGNHYFKSGKFQKSIHHYTKALELDPTASLIYLNRAFAYLKLGQWKEASEDCSKALEFDPKSVKAYWRRSQARKELGQFNEAKQDLEKALVLEPQNQAIREAIKSLLPPSTTTSMDSLQSQSKSMPTRRRLTIREIDSEIKIPLGPTSKSSSPLKSSKVTEVATSTNPLIPKVIQKPSMTKTSVAPLLPENLPKVTQSWQPPTAAYEFDRDMKSISDPSIRREYFKSILPTKLPSLFKSSIDATQLSICINILQNLKENQELPNLIYNYLYFLSQCPRFSIIHTLLDSNDQSIIISLFNFLQTSFENNPSAFSKISLLRPKYGI